MRMFGFIGNRADIGARVLELEPSVLRVHPAANEPVGWGIGFYQSGEVLMRRRPLDERREIDLSEVVRDVKSDVLVGHVRKPTVGNLRTENTHPFRYRQWLFASTATVGHFDQLRERLLESQPEFLRRNVRGDTDTECLFYLFLSFLHDAGHLADERVSPDHVRQALRASVSLIDRLSAEVGGDEQRGNVLVTNGEHLYAVHRAGNFAYRVLEGRADVEPLLPGEDMRGRRIPSVENTHFSLVATDIDRLPEGWDSVDPGSLITFHRVEAPQVEAL